MGSPLVVRRPPAGWLRARSRHSTLVGGNPPPRLGAVGPDLEFGSPPVGRNEFAAVQRERVYRAVDVGAAPRKLSGKDDKGSVECALAGSLPERHTVYNIHGGAPSPDNRGDKQDEIL